MESTLTKVLIDADTVAFSCAATAEEAELWVATSRANEMIENIIQATDATEYELWLTGPNNFRYQVFPEYKANRIGGYRPKWEKETKEFLIDNWNANVSEGCEADDMVGVRQCESENTIIAHIDKDIDMIPGWHYTWPIVRKGTVVREAKKYYVTPEEAHRFFCYQLLIGDPTDGLKGVVGVGPKKANAILDGNKPEDWLEIIRGMYSCDEELILNAQCLWIWRKLNDIWKLPDDLQNY
jgi:DNA polymerase-1